MGFGKSLPLVLTLKILFYILCLKAVGFCFCPPPLCRTISTILLFLFMKHLRQDGEACLRCSRGGCVVCYNPTWVFLEHAEKEHWPSALCSQSEHAAPMCNFPFGRSVQSGSAAALSLSVIPHFDFDSVRMSRLYWQCRKSVKT